MSSIRLGLFQFSVHKSAWEVEGFFGDSGVSGFVLFCLFCRDYLMEANVPQSRFWGKTLLHFRSHFSPKIFTEFAVLLSALPSNSLTPRDEPQKSLHQGTEKNGTKSLMAFVFFLLPQLPHLKYYQSLSFFLNLIKCFLIFGFCYTSCSLFQNRKKT